MKYDINIFRAYDVRGKYGEDLNEDIAFQIGRAFCTFLGMGSNIAVGRDLRPSSESLFKNLVSGILESGCNVMDLGIVPSPLVYFGVKHLKLNAGVMVTASHLPPEWNGFKFCDFRGITLFQDNGLDKIKNIFLERKFLLSKKGNYKKYINIVRDYLEIIMKNIKITKKFRIVLDYGNSVAAFVVPELMKKLGMEIQEINEKLYVNIPNRGSELTEESLEELKNKVIEINADLGIAYDGDGDRVAFVDENGKIYTTGNILIPIFAEHILKSHQGGKIVFDVTCSSAVYDYIKSLGGIPIVTRVGHSYIANAVFENDALMGGQYSGHICFSEFECSDDAIYSSLKMLEILSSTDKRLSDLVSKIPLYETTRIKEIECADQTKFLIIEKVAKIAKNRGYKIVQIDGVKIVTDDGWVLIRASNTSPIIRVNAEGKSAYYAMKMQELGENLVKEAINQ